MPRNGANRYVSGMILVTRCLFNSINNKKGIGRKTYFFADVHLHYQTINF
jgi:Asp-tRNA(Asn)/Glu-tRNA(Gln) amidotransferase B subunit